MPISAKSATNNGQAMPMIMRGTISIGRKLIAANKAIKPIGSITKTQYQQLLRCRYKSTITSDQVPAG